MPHSPPGMSARRREIDASRKKRSSAEKEAAMRSERANHTPEEMKPMRKSVSASGTANYQQRIPEVPTSPGGSLDLRYKAHRGAHKAELAQYHVNLQGTMASSQLIVNSLPDVIASSPVSPLVA